MIKSRLLQGKETILPVHEFQSSTSTAFRLTNQRSPAELHVGRSPTARRRAISEAPMSQNYKLLPIAANSLFNRLPHSAFKHPLSPLSLRSSGSPKMASNDSIKPENEDQLNSVFQQKRVLRSSVRKALKAMDPSLRSQEGTNWLLCPLIKFVLLKMLVQVIGNLIGHCFMMFLNRGIVLLCWHYFTGFLLVSQTVQCRV